MEKAKHLKIGEIGEDVAVKHLMKQGYKILERNYRKKWGEIDIITRKKKILHFIEVKTVSCVTKFNEYFPEENVHHYKKRRLARAINTYLAERKVTHETEFVVDVMAVFYDPRTGESKIRITENILLL